MIGIRERNRFRNYALENIMLIQISSDIFMNAILSWASRIRNRRPLPSTRDQEHIGACIGIDFGRMGPQISGFS